MRNSFRAAVAIAILLAGSLPYGQARAQAFPNRPITLISNVPPGSPQDLVLRTMADIVSKDLGQPVIVDNKLGATGTLGPATMAATAKPDGYTVASVINTLVLVSLMQKVSYDPFKDFTYIMRIVGFPVGVAVRADSPFKTWADVVAHAKANSGAVTYGTPGPGTNVHLGMERIQKHDGTKLTHVPHIGAMAIIPAVLGGHVMLQVTGTEWKPQVDAGQMRLLVMGTATRHPTFPDVPTLRELGYPFDIEVPFGLAGPKGMDPAIVAVLHNAFKKAAETPSVVALIGKYDFIPRYANGDDFRKFMEENRASMKPIIDGLGLARKE